MAIIESFNYYTAKDNITNLHDFIIAISEDMNDFEKYMTGYSDYSEIRKEILKHVHNATDDEIKQTLGALIPYVVKYFRPGRGANRSIQYTPVNVVSALLPYTKEILVQLAEEGRDDIFKHIIDIAAAGQVRHDSTHRSFGQFDKEYIFKALVKVEPKPIHLIDYIVDKGFIPGSVASAMIWNKPVNWTRSKLYKLLLTEYGYKDITSDRAKKNNNLLLVDAGGNKYGFYKDGMIRGFSVRGFGGDESPFILKKTNMIVKSLSDADKLFEIFLKTIVNKAIRSNKDLIMSMPTHIKRRKPKKDDAFEIHTAFWEELINYLLENDPGVIAKIKELPLAIMPEDIRELVKSGFIM